jgi:galactokinase
LTLQKLRDKRWVEKALVDFGMASQAATRHAERFARIAEELSRLTILDHRAIVAAFVPGRIELLGKHTDYAGGRSLVCALDRGFCMVAIPRDDQTVSIEDTALSERVTFELSAELTPSSGHWSNYPMNVARRIARNFEGPLRGAVIAFDSDLPAASGLSSSSAFMIATFLVLSQINNLSHQQLYRDNIPNQESLAEYLGTIENGQSYRQLAGDRGVGTFGGSEDHTAILCSEPGLLKSYAYAPTRLQSIVPMPIGHTFAIGFSGLKAEKTGAAKTWFNDTAKLAADGAAVWRQATGCDAPHLAAVIASQGFTIERFEQAIQTALAPELAGQCLQRFRHFLLEDQAVIPTAINALATGDLAEFAGLVEKSQWGAEQLLGNQVAATQELVRSALDAGAIAASSFGAGFGGSAWALLADNGAKKICEQWAQIYRTRLPSLAADAQFFVTSPGPPAILLR